MHVVEVLLAKAVPFATSANDRQRMHPLRWLHEQAQLVPIDLYEASQPPPPPSGTHSDEAASFSHHSSTAHASQDQPRWPIKARCAASLAGNSMVRAVHGDLMWSTATSSGYYLSAHWMGRISSSSWSTVRSMYKKRRAAPHSMAIIAVSNARLVRHVAPPRRHS